MSAPLLTKPIPLGVDDYEKMVLGGYLYVDKTLLIQEFWEDGAEVILATRPRRFGKSIALSMIRYFFEKTEESKAHLFTHTKIWQEEKFRELQGSYPVFYVSFKDIKYDSWEQAYKKIKTLLAEEVCRVLGPFYEQLEPRHRLVYKSLIEETADVTKFSESILFVTRALEKILKKKTIVLIDEYDTPITYAYLKGYLEEATNFIRNLFSEGLKSNPHLHRSFMTGVVRTAKDGILSGLNHPKICTMLHKNFSDKFGFTQKEVENLLQQTNLSSRQEEVKAWYNGYIIGAEYLSDPTTAHFSASVYNPWSILSYLESAASPKIYWANTGSTELLERMIAGADEYTQKDLQFLLEGRSLQNKLIDQDVILLELNKKKIEPWSFLFFAGYITTTNAQFKDNELYYTLSIPNQEILMLYKKLAIQAIGKRFASQDLTALLDALITGEVSTFSRLLEQFIQSLCSFHDVPHTDLERSLHLFVLGLLASLSERYIIKSNLESGDGRYDIAMHPKNIEDPAVILEFKKSPSSSRLESLSKQALKQIEANNYQALLHDFGYKGKVLCYGIAAFKKHVVVKCRILP
ncbi:MAG: hypothetical protein FJZ58_05250 [Chlamydiae bacterium]|nr:hypothetical protein [Chlamydiota bacterium]